MELERRYIERRDFPPTRRGYDPDEVDRHLRAIADAVEQQRSTAPQQPSIAHAAAQRVETIVAAAEASAREIEERAQADARAAREQADADARRAREEATASVAEHVRRAEEVATSLIERGRQLQAQVDELVARLKHAADSVGGTLNEGAAGLRHELDSMRQDLGSLRPVERDLEPEPAFETAAAEPSFGQAAEAEPPFEEVAAAVPEPEPDPEPEPLSEPGPDALQEAEQQVHASGGDAGRASEGARLIALNMALSGTPREETARYLRENFDLDDQDELLDDVYARAGG